MHPILEGCLDSQPVPACVQPADFVPISFYKLFGYPSGVGALLVRREAAALLRKLYWGGGATFLATSTLDWLSWFDPPSRFEDGTLPFLNILALRYGLAVYDRLGGPAAVLRHVDAVGTWMYRQLAALRHSNGAPLLHIFGRHGHPNRQAAEVQLGIHGLGWKQYTSAGVRCHLTQAPITPPLLPTCPPLLQHTSPGPDDQPAGPQAQRRGVLLQARRRGAGSSRLPHSDRVHM